MSHLPTVQTRFLHLRAEGHSYQAIANELKIAKSTLLGWSRKFQPHLDALRAIHLETIKEQYQLLQHHDLELLAKQLKAVRDEFNQRDLSDVPTPRLLDMQLKILTAIQKLPIVPIEFLPIPDNLTDFDDPTDETTPDTKISPNPTAPQPTSENQNPTNPDHPQSSMHLALSSETKTSPKPDHPTPSLQSKIQNPKSKINPLTPKLQRLVDQADTQISTILARPGNQDNQILRQLQENLRSRTYPLTKAPNGHNGKVRI